MGVHNQQSVPVIVAPTSSDTTPTNVCARPLPGPRNPSATSVKSLSERFGHASEAPAALPSSRPSTPSAGSKIGKKGVLAAPAAFEDRTLPTGNTVDLRAGTVDKPFTVHIELLTSRSSWFKKLFDDAAAAPAITSISPFTQTRRANETTSCPIQTTTNNNHLPMPKSTTAPHPTRESLTFPQANEFAFALLIRSLYGATLSGPHDFHSLQHYLGLYVLAAQFRMTLLQNHVIDLVRRYYKKENMTAPAYRLEYIYGARGVPISQAMLNESVALSGRRMSTTTMATMTPAQFTADLPTLPDHDPMKRFLVSTAAYRVLKDPHEPLTESMKMVIAKGGDLAVDFCEALRETHGNGCEDVREWADERFYVCEDGKEASAPTKPHRKIVGEEVGKIEVD